MATLVKNKKAHFDFEILEEIEAGVELLGTEVKALKSNLGSLVGARVVVRGGEALLIGATIPSYQPNNTPENYDPERTRRLLLSKKQVLEVQSAEESDGLTTIPLSWYNKGRLVKLSIGIGRGKKKADKRQKIKARDIARDIGRALKARTR
ncbi:SsrA-binding protein SmpB [Candidatus Wolfebacteria bacterium]|nr:SsrA-binding protein SmpB [Candidatus Wolfebacteria bacterium]